METLPDGGCQGGSAGSQWRWRAELVAGTQMPEHEDGRNTEPFHLMLATGTSWTLTTWAAGTLQRQTRRHNCGALIFGVEDLASGRERWEPCPGKLIGYTGALHAVCAHIHAHLIKQSRQHCPASRTPQHTRFQGSNCVCVCVRTAVSLIAVSSLSFVTSLLSARIAQSHLKRCFLLLLLLSLLLPPLLLLLLLLFLPHLRHPFSL